MIDDRPSARIAAFVHTYAALPEHFFARVDPTPVEAPRLITINRSLAAELGVDVGNHDDELLAAVFAGNVIPQGASPIAMAYAGHQFGHFVPQLGDGRAILLGEVWDRTGARRDVQLKGSGWTPFSRNGDGRAALGPVLREYLVSEAMHALGIPATRSLAAVTTGARIRRDGLVPGAVLTRVAASHVRVGTFQYFAARGDAASVRQLADYVIDRHYPDARASDRPYLALLEAVSRRQALLVARWMQVGFIHGVMNTDNMALSGETIDFGPCAFMDTYDPQAAFSSIDTQGRYAYANQPSVAQWNLARLAETLLPLVDPVRDRSVEYSTEIISAFAGHFADSWLGGMRDKLGLLTAQDGDLGLVHGFLDLMHRNLADFTIAFRRLCDAAESDQADGAMRTLFLEPAAYDEWAERWRSRLAREEVEPRVRADAMRRANPAFIPRNHRIEQVIAAAVGQEDFAPFFELLDVLSRPFEARQPYLAYTNPPTPDERVRETFCGT